MAGPAACETRDVARPRLTPNDAPTTAVRPITTRAMPNSQIIVVTLDTGYASTTMPTRTLTTPDAIAQR
nr:hypothetical protein [Actinophytocola sp.]